MVSPTIAGIGEDGMSATEGELAEILHDEPDSRS
jgi:hypothetical protein